MEKQNITLSIPKEILLKVKLLAVKRQTSVSGLLTGMLERLVQQEDAYAHARQRHLQELKEGVDLSTKGHLVTGREELHERVYKPATPRQQHPDLGARPLGWSQAHPRNGPDPRFWNLGAGCLNFQVLQEFYANSTQKVAKPLAPDAAARIIAELSVW